MKRVSWSTVLALTVGTVVGVAVVVFGFDQGDEGRTQRELGPSRAKGIDSDKQDDGRLAALEKQVASLRHSLNEQRTEVAAAEAQPGDRKRPAIDEPPVDSRSPEEIRRQTEVWVAGHERNLDRHRSQARDLSWAPSMESSISEGFSALPADIKAKIEDVECRTASCAVTLTWGSEMEAKTEMESIARAVGQLPCSTEIGLPLDPPENGPVEVQLYMGCERRAL